MKALLDTNIIIHRENTKVTNPSIGNLFFWLDKLRIEKMIHPATVTELRKRHDQNIQRLYDVNLQAYTHIRSVGKPTEKFTELLEPYKKQVNDEIDDQLLFEVYAGRVDILITEDRAMHKKATVLGIDDKLFTIDTFIDKSVSEHPEFKAYKVLCVQKEIIGDIDVNNSFFDDLRSRYNGFDNWFARKSNEEAYVGRDENNQILGFLFLKIEDESTPYQDISPTFVPKRRLKIGTFKVESTGYRLGERFLKIIFDNALSQKVKEVYVTMFENAGNLIALKELLLDWGFIYHGVKTTISGTETVLVKSLEKYSPNHTIKQNFPNINYSTDKFILPILPKYHTDLLPDSFLKNEKVDLINNFAHRYALQKVYITWADMKEVNNGDILLFYRTKDRGKPATYSSVVTTIGVIEDFRCKFNDRAEYLSYCQNRSVFSLSELNGFWDNHRATLSVIKFLLIKELTKKVILKFLREQKIVDNISGPRGFHKLTEEQFQQIIEESKTTL